VFKKNSQELQKLGYLIQTHREHNFAVVCTPIMQNYLRIIEKSVKSTNHVSLTTELTGKPTNKCILVVSAPTGVGPVPVCVAFYIRKMNLIKRDKLHQSVRAVLEKFKLTCDIDCTHEQYVLPETEELPKDPLSKDFCMPDESANEFVTPDADLSNNSLNAFVTESVLLNQEVHKGQQDEMEVDANRTVDDPLEQVKTEQVEAFNVPILDSGSSKVAVEENSIVAHVDINKTRINLNYIADLVSVFQSDPHVISAVSVFNANVDRIETPQQLVAFMTNFVPSLKKI
jgi:hypothetical protein